MIILYFLEKKVLKNLFLFFTNSPFHFHEYRKKSVCINAARGRGALIDNLHLSCIGNQVKNTAFSRNVRYLFHTKPSHIIPMSMMSVIKAGRLFLMTLYISLKIIFFEKLRI